MHFTLRHPDLLFMLLGACWGGYELLLGRRRRAADGGARDQGTLQLLWRVLYAALAVAVLLSLLGIWRYAPALQAPARWLGCALLAGGLALRVWAIRVLARWFTVDVTIQEGHQLIRHGPYRRLRHPSYTGALLAFYGLAIGLGNLLSLPVIVLPVTWAFLRRIRVEEAALTQAFPREYPDYAAHSWRLLPFVW
ncbi:methyltransferase family protein [Xanthomonas theicola]|uniref:Protein-S-isoprenylcysteine methyltransferase n=1 Tax=Xanthomonas theicola TaxID=56464 RepID=A0A2S6ZG23_9XANT|nr:PEMT/PEM2 methyltransferase family protein [Xanthomonas theicola]PPT91214.1 protein-S-isoprenylcysteine methyltransferase [Xanthomonas theicola]QNH25912.1 protein-S-isoprenylcysteine methyltransferase [Xanthomonas theicola]